MGKKYIKITVIAILLALVYTTIVNAYSFNVTITPDSTTVAESSEFTVKVKVANLDVGNNGINSLSGYFKYDTKYFETINESSIEGRNSWILSAFNPDNGKMTFTKTTFVKDEEEVFLVTLQTKAGSSGHSGEISFENIVASNSAQQIQTTNVSTTITIGSSGDIDANTENVQSNFVFNVIVSNLTNNNVVNETANNTVNNVVNNTTNNVVNNVVHYNAVNNNTNSIPYTGVEDTVIYIIGIVIIIAAVFYIKIEKINKELR